MMTKSILVLGLSAISMSAFGTSVRWTLQRSEQEVVLEKFVPAADGWQERALHRTFQNETQLQSFLSKVPQQEVANLEQTQTPSGVELRGVAGSLWEATAKWDLRWEDRFSEWIANEVDPQFFVRNQIATDCADVFYSLRWIFARIHHLEMASRLSGSGDWLTHRSLRNSWANLPTSSDWRTDRRFRAALDYLLDNTYTHSLMQDSYPIQITSDSVREGVYHLDLHRDSGHTQIISRTDRNGDLGLPFIIFQSTTPRKVREVSYGGFWYRSQPLKGKGGLLRLRWPMFQGNSVSLVAPSQMPFFSEDQYDSKFLRKENYPFNQEVYLRLRPNLDFSKVLLKAYESLQSMFLERAKVVQEGFEICQRQKCDPTSQVFDDWSTPSRDARARDLIQQAEVIRDSFGDRGVRSLLEKPFLKVEEEVYSLQAVISAWKGNRFSSDPRMSVETRWGLSAIALKDWSLKRASDLLFAREKLLNSKNDAWEVDRNLSALRHQLLQYFSQAPVAQQNEWHRLSRQRDYVVRGQKLSAIELTIQIPWLSGSATASSEKQWGLHAQKYLSVDLFRATEVSHDEKGWTTWTSYDGRKFLLNRKTKKNLELQSDRHYLLIRSSLGPAQLIAWRAGELWSVDPETGSETLLLRGQNFSSVENYDSSLILRDESASLYWVGAFSSQAWHWTGPMPFLNKPLIGIFDPVDLKKNCVLMSEPGQEVIWSFFDIPKKHVLPMSSMALEACNAEYAILKSQTGRFFYSFVTEAATLLPDLDGPVIWEHSAHSGFLITGTDPLKMNSKFFVLNSQPRLGWGASYPGIPNVFFDQVAMVTPGSFSGRRTFTWRGDQLVENVPLADELTVLDRVGDDTISFTKQKQYRWRNSRGQQMEFTGSIWLVRDWSGASAWLGTSDFERGVMSIRALKSPQEPLIQSAIAEEGWSRFGELVPEGVLAPTGIWIL